MAGRVGNPDAASSRSRDPETSGTSRSVGTPVWYAESHGLASYAFSDSGSAACSVLGERRRRAGGRGAPVDSLVEPRGDTVPTTPSADEGAASCGDDVHADRRFCHGLGVGLAPELPGCTVTWLNGNRGSAHGKMT